MKKLVLWLGIIMLVVFGILIFISGSLDSSGALVYPSLNKGQSIWTVLTVIGVVFIIIGGIWSLATRKK